MTLPFAWAPVKVAFRSSLWMRFLSSCFFRSLFVQPRATLADFFVGMLSFYFVSSRTKGDPFRTVPKSSQARFLGPSISFCFILARWRPFFRWYFLWRRFHGSSVIPPLKDHAFRFFFFFFWHFRARNVLSYMMPSRRGYFITSIG